MEKKPTLKQKLEMQKYVIALRAKIQSRAEELQQTCEDEQKCKFAKLQDEITALAELYRHYYCEIFADGNKLQLGEIYNIEQIEKIFADAKAQMIAGDISKEHLIEVAESAKKALTTVCKAGNLNEYADMLLSDENSKVNLLAAEKELKPLKVDKTPKVNLLAAKKELKPIKQHEDAER